MAEEKFMHFEDAWESDAVQRYLIRINQMMVGEISNYSNADYVQAYAVIYNACTQRSPFNYSRRFYEKHKELYQEIICDLLSKIFTGQEALTSKELVLLCFRLLKSLKIAIKHLGILFRYLDRYYIKYHNLPTLEAVAKTEIQETLTREFQKRDYGLQLVEECIPGFMSSFFSLNEAAMTTGYLDLMFIKLMRDAEYDRTGAEVGSTHLIHLPCNNITTYQLLFFVVEVSLILYHRENPSPPLSRRESGGDSDLIFEGPRLIITPKAGDITERRRHNLEKALRDCFPTYFDPQLRATISDRIGLGLFTNLSADELTEYKLLKLIEVFKVENIVREVASYL